MVYTQMIGADSQHQAFLERISNEIRWVVILSNISRNLVDPFNLCKMKIFVSSNTSTATESPFPRRKEISRFHKGVTSF